MLNCAFSVPTCGVASPQTIERSVTFPAAVPDPFDIVHLVNPIGCLLISMSYVSPILGLSCPSLGHTKVAGEIRRLWIVQESFDLRLQLRPVDPIRMMPRKVHLDHVCQGVHFLYESRKKAAGCADNLLPVGRPRPHANPIPILCSAAPTVGSTRPTRVVHLSPKQPLKSPWRHELRSKGARPLFRPASLRFKAGCGPRGAATVHG